MEHTRRDDTQREAAEQTPGGPSASDGQAHATSDGQTHATSDGTAHATSADGTAHATASDGQAHATASDGQTHATSDGQAHATSDGSAHATDGEPAGYPPDTKAKSTGKRLSEAFKDVDMTNEPPPPKQHAAGVSIVGIEAGSLENAPVRGTVADRRIHRGRPAGGARFGAGARPAAAASDGQAHATSSDKGAHATSSDKDAHATSADKGAHATGADGHGDA